VVGLGPFRAVLFDDVAALRESHLERHEREKIRRRAFQPHLQRRVVERGDPAFFIVFQFSLVEILRVDNIKQRISVLGRGFWFEQALPGEFEISRDDFFAVAPRRILAQVKDDSLALVEHVPGLRDDRRRFQIFVELGEADHEIRDHVEGDVIGRERPVEAGRFGAQIDPKGFAVGASGGAVTRGESEKCEDGKNQAAKEFSEWKSQGISACVAIGLPILVPQGQPIFKRKAKAWTRGNCSRNTWSSKDTGTYTNSSTASPSERNRRSATGSRRD